MATISGAELALHSGATPKLTPKSLGKPPLPIIPPVRANTGPVLQRIDVEPIYTALKSAIAENWSLYKESFSLYVTGQLNQDELSRRIDSFVCHDSSISHLHNQLLCAVHTNSQRDAPEPGVAIWVSANDKPTTAAKPVTGDKAELRLKTEIMNLPPRERHRLKALQEDGGDVFTRTMAEYHAAKQMNRLPDLVPTSAGGFNKTNWEIEIHKRYTQPLFAESSEFPEPESIQARMVPICYEEGLTQGAAAGCSDIVNVAAETCIRELLTDIFYRVRTNGPTFIQTSKYKRRILKEETAFGRGTLTRDAAGLLPAEAETMAQRPPLGLQEFRLALELGNSFMSQLRLVSDRMTAGYWIDDEHDGTLFAEKATTNGTASTAASSLKVNGHLSNGVTNGVIHEEPEDINWSWQGGASSDLDFLGSLLDDCLLVGQ